MSFTISNISQGSVAIGTKQLGKGETVSVKALTNSMLDAKKAGYITISPNLDTPLTTLEVVVEADVNSDAKTATELNLVIAAHNAMVAKVNAMLTQLLDLMETNEYDK